MTIRLRAPIELENLLPFDIKYRIYDTTSRRTWTSYLRRGGLMPIHCVHLDQCVMFSAEIQETSNAYHYLSGSLTDGLLGWQITSLVISRLSTATALLMSLLSLYCMWKTSKVASLTLK